MSTNSNVAIIDKNGRAKVIYGHWDGYPSGLGKTLLIHYNNGERAEELLGMGDFSSLAPTIAESVFYYRDKGEPYSGVDGVRPAEMKAENLTKKIYKSFRGDSHLYVFDVRLNQWMYYEFGWEDGDYPQFADGKLRPLIEFMDKDSLDEVIKAHDPEPPKKETNRKKLERLRREEVACSW